MTRNRALAAVVALLLVVGLGAWLYSQVLGDTEAASEPITAIPLATQAPAAAEAPAAEAPAAAAPVAESAAPNETLRYQIVPDESEVRFSLSEELRGQPVTVVGATNQIAGELAVNPSDLSAAQVGVIQVNARTLATDSEQRNRAIRNFILGTDTHEYITFAPKEIQGLSGSAAASQPYSFQIHGDLTIRDVTQPVTFETTVQADSAERLIGTATTVVKRSDFGLTIPSVPFVANVGEEVTIEIDFAAAAVSQ